MGVTLHTLLMSLLKITCLLAQPINWNECGKSKGCFFSPKECNSETSCKYLLTYQETGSRVSFEMSGIVDFPLQNSYVAVAFSDDKLMDEDSVIECVHDVPTGEVNIFPSYDTLGKGNSRINIPLLDAGLVLHNSSYIDGVIRCRFTREKVVDHDLIYNLNNGWYLQMANGHATSSNIGLHLLDPLPVVSDDRVSVLGFGIDEAETSSRAMAVAHGCLMVIGWIFFVSLGTFTAKYYKEEWEEKPMKLAVRFQVHQRCMEIAWTCSLCATILIIVKVSGWVSNPGDSFAHSIVGMIAICLGFLQPFFVCCCRPGSADHPWYNWIHQGIGVTAHVLAITTIFLAFRFMYIRHALPFYMFYIMGAYVVWQVLCETVRDTHAYCIAKKSKPAKDIPFQSVNQESSAVAEGTLRSQKSFGFQTFLLLFYAIVLLVISIVVIVLLILKWGKTE